jgi:hypothetical protein
VTSGKSSSPLQSCESRETGLRYENLQKQWLLGQDKRIGAVGDLARDFRMDCGVRKPDEPPLPRRFTVDAFREYLEFRSADRALLALEEAAAEYKSYRTFGR